MMRPNHIYHFRLDEGDGGPEQTVVEIQAPTFCKAHELLIAEYGPEVKIIAINGQLSAEEHKNVDCIIKSETPMEAKGVGSFQNKEVRDKIEQLPHMAEFPEDKDLPPAAAASESKDWR